MRNFSLKMGGELIKNDVRIFISFTILIKVCLVLCKPIQDNNEIKWKPIKDFKITPESKSSTQADFMKPSESIERVSRLNNDDKVLIKDQPQLMPACASIFREQILEALASQTKPDIIDQQQSAEFNKKAESSSQENSSLFNKSQINNVIRHSRALADPSNDNNEDDDSYEDEPIGDEQTDSMLTKNSINEDNNKDLAAINSQMFRQDKQRFGHDYNNQNRLDKDSTNLEQQRQPVDDELALRREQEANESSEAEAADRSALDEQQQQQREIILAQAEHEAKAIKEQQELLLKQQKLQQQMVFMRDRNDLNSNTSDNNLVGSIVDRKKLPKQESFVKKRPSSQTDIQFSDQPYFDLGKVDSIEQNELIQEENKPKVSSSLSDLIPSAQHNYGAHYGALTNHQSHYYQFVESHKKGQYDSGFKRGNKKFKSKLL